jgi:hypothetical protein
MRRFLLFGIATVGWLITQPVWGQSLVPGKALPNKAAYGRIGPAKDAPPSPPAAAPPAGSTGGSTNHSGGGRDSQNHERHSNGGGSGHGHHGHGGWQHGGWNGGGWHGGGWNGGGINVWTPWIWTGYTPLFPSYSYFGYDATYSPVPNLARATPIVTPPAPAPAPANDPDPVPRGKITNAEQRALAGKFIGYGDANFGKQRYLAAIERYKRASNTAPEMAEPYFRQAIAWVALGQPENAAIAYRRALKIQATWSGPPFRLDQLYVGTPAIKTAHLETLAKAAEANPFNSEILLVLGMELYFDGQPDRAALFFERCSQLGGNDDHLLNSFIPQPKPGASPPGKMIF